MNPVHKKCYNKIIQYTPSVDEYIPSNDSSIFNEQNHDKEQGQVINDKLYLEDRPYSLIDSKQT
jgi:uncharacterized phage-associated protein